MNPTLLAWLVPGVPFLVSLSLSLATVGDGVFWQDSGFYLCAIREMSVLYPPGFVLYQLLCKAWTLALPFVNFTLAVHLFSSLCAAAASGVLALACRELFRASTPGLRVSGQQPGRVEDGASMIAGCLVAAGFTFWTSAIYAKGYSFFYLILSLLLWRMIRAAETRRPREFTIVAALIGLAWQAHPSATGAGLCFLLFVMTYRTVLGAKGIAWRSALAAFCALGPALLLPVLARNESAVAFGEPRTMSDLLEYLFGRRFVTRNDAFGLRTSRMLAAAQFFWEEYLAVGIVLLGVGVATLARRCPRVLVAMLLWSVPYSAITVLFLIEGQHEHWYVAAWLPFSLAMAVGLQRLARAAGRRAGLVLAALGIAGIACSVALNAADVDQRGNLLPELLGRIHLDAVAPRSILITTSDDVTASTHYLQVVRGIRKDVLLVRPSHLNSTEDGRSGWYDRCLLRRSPGLPFPSYVPARTQTHARTKLMSDIAAFVNATVSPQRIVYVEEPPPAEMIRPDYVLVPAGALMKVVPRESPSIDPRDWDFPIGPEDVRKRFRRNRGMSHERMTQGERQEQEPYERRLFLALLRARVHLADWQLSHGQVAEARSLYESILAIDPETGRVLDVVYPLAVSTFSQGDRARAEPLLLRVLALNPAGRELGMTLYCLGEIRRLEGRFEDARRYYQQALQIPELEPNIRGRVVSLLSPK